MLQRKRPASSGPSSQRHQPNAKKAKLNQTRPAAAIGADQYSQLAAPTTAPSTPSTTRKSPTSLTPTSNKQPTATVSLPAAFSSPLTTSRLTAPVSSSRTKTAQQNAAGHLPPTTSRPTSVSLPPALSQLHFLLSSAHLTALSAPATSRHLIRLMRHLAVDADIPIAATVDQRYCDECSTLLVPGVNCSLTTKRDTVREERWRKKQMQRLQGREAARQQREEEQTVKQAERRATEIAPVRAVTRKERHRAREREERVKRVKQRDADMRAAGVTFVSSVNVCGHCGHDNVLADTQRKRGGQQCDDVRKRDSADGRQPTIKRKQSAATTLATSTEPHNKADRARQERLEKRKAQQRTEKLKKQQTISGGQSTAVSKAAGKAATSGPDPFAGSLFLKFQKPVSRHSSHTHCTHSTTHSLNVCLLMWCAASLVWMVVQSKHGVESAAAAVSSRPFSFSHPTAPTTPSTTSQPFIHTRAAPTSASSLTLLEQVAKQKKAVDKEQKRLARLQQQPGQQTQTASKVASGGSGSGSAGAGASGVSLGGGGLYGLLQSFQQ